MDQNELSRLYVDLKWSQRKIATHFSVSQTSVRYYLKKFSIKRKKPAPIRGIDRTCTKCLVFKTKDHFYSNENGLGGSWCKLCLSKSVVERQNRNKQSAVDYKGGSCKSCGFSAYLGALEFHHLDPTEKDFEISRFSSRFDERLKIELNKCVLLCSNCHRMVHAGIISL